LQNRNFAVPLICNLILGQICPGDKKKQDKNNIIMSKKFTEYSQLNLSEVNKEVLKKWDENDVFSRSMTEREGHPSFVLRRSSLGKWYAGYSPRDGSYH
jgi:hypothetical protein